jgi:hypothetical protein
VCGCLNITSGFDYLNIKLYIGIKCGILSTPDYVFLEMSTLRVSGATQFTFKFFNTSAFVPGKMELKKKVKEMSNESKTFMSSLFTFIIMQWRLAIREIQIIISMLKSQ